jgi:indole-3-glycerol phosphate synthase
MAKTTRKVAKVAKAKVEKVAKATRKGNRTLSPALKKWNEKVMKVYREMKKKDPSTRLGDAMKAAKKMD